MKPKNKCDAIENTSTAIAQNVAMLNATIVYEIKEKPIICVTNIFIADLDICQTYVHEKPLRKCSLHNRGKLSGHPTHRLRLVNLK